MKKLEATKIQWRARYATKQGELDAVKVSRALCIFLNSLTTGPQRRAVAAGRVAQGGLVVVRLDAIALLDRTSRSRRTTCSPRQQRACISRGEIGGDARPSGASGRQMGGKSQGI